MFLSLSATILPASFIQRLQSVQNAAARLIFNMRRSEHITDALISLHWLRVPERIIFKVATMTFRALHGTPPPYTTSQFTCVADMPNRRRLRSASSNQLDVPSFRLLTVGNCVFPNPRTTGTYVSIVTQSKYALVFCCFFYCYCYHLIE